MSIFDDAFAAAGDAIDVVFGEDFEAIPRARVGGDVNARLVADPSREPFGFVGSFVAVDEEFHTEGRRMPQTATRASSAPRTTIDVAVSELRYVPKSGDLVRRLKTGEVFEVSKTPADSVGRISIELAERQARAG
ncbi:MAG: hypothetical protein DI565_13940 [Ancylobacter novellus]|uniref:Head-tail adaptor protein n=1 Tax=Ancylobacter novellus TaxID=921 RepID=A0A2W5KC87_ANCNO|nr:MAG: hypothetical protein DI565_13940 [Ancylobacter novellus]